MPVDTQQIMDEASKLGDLVAQHPAVSRYKDARKAVEQDAEANRLCPSRPTCGRSIWRW